jgi:hypothetical protein
VLEEVSNNPEAPVKLIQYDVLPEHVVGLVEALKNLEGAADPLYIGDTGESIEAFPTAIDVAEALGLVKYEGGYVRLTELGVRVAEADTKRLRKILKESVISNKVEPLYTVYKVLKEKKAISIEELKSIAKKFWGTEKEEAIKNLILWGVYLRLFKLSPDNTQIILVG